MSAQAPRQKFTFDTEFHAGGDRAAPAALARQKKTLTQAELDLLRQEARSEGENAAAARSAHEIERTLAALASAIRAALDSGRAEIEAVRAESAAIALAAAKKLAALAIAALPAADVETALREAMHQAIAEPRLTLRARPEVAQLLEARLAPLGHEEGYEGRIHLAADPNFEGADCRIEWRGGGVERSFETIAAALTQLIEQRFSELSSSRLKG